MANTNTNTASSPAPVPTSGPCPDCGRAIGWDGHPYRPCGVTR